MPIDETSIDRPICEGSLRQPGNGGKTLSATVEKALQLIEALARSEAPRGISQLGRDLGLNKSTVFRLVDTLVRQGFARQDPGTGRYALTPKLWELGVGVVRDLGLRQAARPALEAEAAATGEATMLGILDGAEALIIDKVDSRQPLQTFSPLGARVSLCVASIGRALLAFQPPAVIEAVTAGYVPLTPRGLRTRAALLRELDRVRAEGWARSVDEWQVGISGVAAPIRGRGGEVAGALCITGPSSRLDAKRMAELAARCVAAAGRVSTVLREGG